VSLPTPSAIGRFQLQARLGQGPTGVVYAAHDPVLDRDVAVKVMLPDVASDATSREWFLREARAIARLRHRHIVAIYDVATDDEPPFFAMELLRSVTLARRLATTPALTLAEGLDLADQLCVALHVAHEHGVMHRHVTPANIWLLDDGGVKLADFGLQPAAGATMPEPRSVVGRVAYIAPEQVAGRPVDGRADIFSAGVVLFELVMGRRPFEAETVTGVFDKLLNAAPAPLANLPDRVAEPLSRIIARALEKDPGRRYPDPLEMAADLTLARLALAGAPAPVVEARPVVESRPEAEPRWVMDPEPAMEPRTIVAPGPVVEHSPGVAHTSVEPARATAEPAKRSTSSTRTRAAIDRMRQPHVPGTTGRFDEPELVRGPAPPRVHERGPLLGLPTPALVGGALAVALAVGVVIWLMRPATPVAPVDGPVKKPNAPAVQAEVNVDIQSEPSDAELFVNGKPLGKRTPATVAADSIKGKEIRAEKAGYEPATVRVLQADIDRRGLQIKLVAEPPSIVVTGSADFPFEVLRGNTVVSELNDTHRFTVRGPQILRLRAREVFFERVVTITGDRSTVALSVPGLGKLSVRTTPSLERCTVSVGGLDFGNPPYPPIQHQPIVAGTHRVQLRCPDGSTRQETVVVEADRERAPVLFH